MKCIKCNTDMKCYDDVTYSCVRIDFVICPSCGSKAEIEYDSSKDMNIDKVTWERNKDN